MSTASPASAGGASLGNSGAALGVEVLTPGATTSGPVSNRASDAPAATGAADKNYGIVAPRPPDNSPLPAAQGPTEAPDAVNEAAGHPTPAAQDKNPNAKKTPKPAYDKNDESSSKHKEEKGRRQAKPLLGRARRQRDWRGSLRTPPVLFRRPAIRAPAGLGKEGGHKVGCAFSGHCLQ